MAHFYKRTLRQSDPGFNPQSMKDSSSEEIEFSLGHVLNCEVHDKSDMDI